MIRLWVRAAGLLIIVMVGLGFVVLSPVLKHIKKRTCFFYQLIIKTVGVHGVEIIGSPLNSAGILMANHISYLDIPILGSLLPCQFVAKQEVSRWPFIGWMAKSFNTIFISRKPHAIQQGLDLVKQALQKGGRLILFPEATTSDGCRILPLKSGYFHLPPETTIQPVSLRYAQVNGLPASRFFQKQYSWRGDVDLITHLRYLLKIRKVRAIVTFHPPFVVHNQHRKELSDLCFHSLYQGFEHS